MHLNKYANDTMAKLSLNRSGIYGETKVRTELLRQNSHLLSLPLSFNEIIRVHTYLARFSVLYAVGR